MISNGFASKTNIPLPKIMKTDSSVIPTVNTIKSSAPKPTLPAENTEQKFKKKSAKVPGSSNLTFNAERKPISNLHVGRKNSRPGSSLSVRYEELRNRVGQTESVSKSASDKRKTNESLGRSFQSSKASQHVLGTATSSRHNKHLPTTVSTRKPPVPPSRPATPKPSKPGQKFNVATSSSRSIDPSKSQVAKSKMLQLSPTPDDVAVQKSESAVSNISNVNPNSFPGQYEHPYFSLPEVVRVKILKLLTPTERLLAQFVCRRFRNDIRLRVGIRTKVTEGTTNGVTFLRDVFVTSILVGKFDRPQTPPSKLIYTPEHVFELIFSEPICAQHIDAFLNRCRKLKWLVVRCAVIDSPTFSATFKNPYYAYEWRTLDTIHKMPILQPHLVEVVMSIPATSCLRSVNRILSMLNAPALKRFAIVINQPITFDETTAVHFAVLNFLRSNLSVSHVMLNTKQKPNLLNHASRSNQFQYIEKEINQSVEKLQLRQVILTEPAVSFELWNTALGNQTSLEVVQVLHMTIWPLLREILVQNFKTLVTVAIHVILSDKFGRHFPTDLAAFSKCQFLKELYICIAPSAPSAESNPKDTFKVNILNFHKLPRQLEILALKHCHLSMKDFINVRNLQNLKCLGVVHHGTHSDGNYIGVKTMRKLLQMNSLDELFLSGIGAEGKEADEIKLMMKQLKLRVSLNKKKQPTHFHCCSSQHNSRWIMQRNGAIIFTIFSTWGLANF